MHTKKGTLSALSALILLLGVIVSACGGNDTAGQAGAGEDSSNGEEELSGEFNLFIWSEYMPDFVIKQFEEETGITVNYNMYSSNEEMVAKISAGASGYDIAVGSDYMVEIMIKQGLLEPIDKSNIPNLENLDEDFLDQAFDPGNEYSIPYMWGNVAIAVNTDLVDQDVTGYKDLWDPAFENSLVVLDDQRNLIGIANKLQGESMSATDPDVLEKSKELLMELKPNIKAFDSDSPKTLLINGEAAAGIVWGTEAHLAKQENPAIEAVLPEEGSNIWMDNFVIPAGAPNKRNAEAFIDFVLRPDVSADITKDFPYANPNKAAHEFIDEDVLNDPVIYSPEEFLEKSEFHQDIGDVILEYDRIWSEFKG